jgi:hypothetical protein
VRSSIRCVSPLAVCFAAAVACACGSNRTAATSSTSAATAPASSASAAEVSPAAAPSGSAVVVSVTDAGADHGPARLTGTAIPLPGAEAPASLDYIAYERARSRVWVPVSSAGAVDVLDIATGRFTLVDGFKTAEREVRGKKRTMGPSAVTPGESVVYVGDRASNQVCPVDATTLKVGPCLTLPSPTDGVAYVESAHEVWVTTPGDQALAVLDASKPGALKAKATVKTDGVPEGYAVDDARGLFFTNLEDKGGTLVIDVKTRKVKATWNPRCGADGPRGLAFDAVHDFVIVACTDHLQVLDAAHDGALLGTLDTGAGVDNIDVLNGVVYVAAARAARLTVAVVDDRGELTVEATGDTAEGARNAVADAQGNVYVPDPKAARLLVFAAPERPPRP